MTDKPISARILPALPHERAAHFRDQRSGADARVTMWRSAAPSPGFDLSRLAIAVNAGPLVVQAPIAQTMLIGPGVAINGAAAARCFDLLTVIMREFDSSCAPGTPEPFARSVAGMLPAIREALARAPLYPGQEGAA